MLRGSSIRNILTVTNIIVRIFFSLLLTSLFLSCTETEEEYFIYDTSKSFVFKDVSYGKYARQKMNVFLPADRTTETKTIILIHGGGWNTGDKNDFDTFASAYAIEGIAAVTVNYRYADTFSGIDYIEILHDIGSAVNCLADSAGRYTISTVNICLLGHSAGGHIALLYAYRNNTDGLVDKVVSLAGPTDLTDPDFLSITGISELVNNLTGNDSGKRQDASPINHADAVTTYLYHGKADAVVPYQQSERLFEKIRNLNSKNYISLIEGCGHGFNLYEFSRIAGETTSLILNDSR